MFGPHNAPYQHLGQHLTLGGLNGLLQRSQREQTITYDLGGFTEFEGSTWSHLCDVNSCLDAPASTSSPTVTLIDSIFFQIKLML